MADTAKQRFYVQIPPIVRFARLVETQANGCWLWQGSCQFKGGQGAFMWDTAVGSQPIKAHRAAWVLFRSEIPAGSWVLHKCDVPHCVNPGHLYLGNARDNVRDRAARNLKSWKRGSEHGRAKLTESDVLHIRQSGENNCELGRRFGVSHVTIHGIRHRRIWRHI